MKENPTPETFVAHCWKNRALLFWGLGLQLVCWILYKCCLPDPDYFSDSNAYIHVAIHQLAVYYRPLGYSWFLICLHFLSDSPTLVVTAQYLLLGWAALGCFFSIDYLLRFRHPWVKYLSWGLMSLQPIFLVLANQLASDSFFAALTIVWFTLLLWILQRPNLWVLFAQVFVLLLAFQVRYTALYYPAIACLTLVLAVRASPRYRIGGIALTLLLTALSYQAVRTTNKHFTGADVYSGFSGWQLANNGLYLSPFIDLRAEKFGDTTEEQLHTYVLALIDSISPAERSDLYKGIPGSAFLWNIHGPLKAFQRHFMQVHHLGYMDAWYQLGPLYAQYGETLIRRHPWVFIRHFLIPNTGVFLVPDPETLSGFHQARVPLTEENARWFGEGIAHGREPWTAVQIAHGREPLTAIQGWITPFYRYGFSVWVFFCMLAPLVYLRKRHSVWWLWYAVFVTNMIFSIVAAQIVLRYECVWFVLGAGLPIWFLDQALSQGFRRIFL